MAKRGQGDALPRLSAPDSLLELPSSSSQKVANEVPSSGRSTLSENVNVNSSDVGPKVLPQHRDKEIALKAVKTPSSARKRSDSNELVEIKGPLSGEKITPNKAQPDDLAVPSIISTPGSSSCNRKQHREQSGTASGGVELPAPHFTSVKANLFQGDHVVDLPSTKSDTASDTIPDIVRHRRLSSNSPARGTGIIVEGVSDICQFDGSAPRIDRTGKAPHIAGAHGQGQGDQGGPPPSINRNVNANIGMSSKKSQAQGLTELSTSLSANPSGNTVQGMSPDIVRSVGTSSVSLSDGETLSTGDKPLVPALDADFWGLGGRIEDISSASRTGSRSDRIPRIQLPVSSNSTSVSVRHGSQSSLQRVYAAPDEINSDKPSARDSDLRSTKNDRILQERLQEAKAMNRKNDLGAVMHKFTLWSKAPNKQQSVRGFASGEVTTAIIDNDFGTASPMKLSGVVSQQKRPSVRDVACGGSEQTLQIDRNVAPAKRSSRLRGPKTAREMKQIAPEIAEEIGGVRGEWRSTSSVSNQKGKKTAALQTEGDDDYYDDDDDDDCFPDEGDSPQMTKTPVNRPAEVMHGILAAGMATFPTASSGLASALRSKIGHAKQLQTSVSVDSLPAATSESVRAVGGKEGSTSAPSHNDDANDDESMEEDLESACSVEEELELQLVSTQRLSSANGSSGSASDLQAPIPVSSYTTKNAAILGSQTVLVGAPTRRQVEKHKGAAGRGSGESRPARVRGRSAGSVPSAGALSQSGAQVQGRLRGNSTGRIGDLSSIRIIQTLATDEAESAQFISIATESVEDRSSQGRRISHLQETVSKDHSSTAPTAELHDQSVSGESKVADALYPRLDTNGGSFSPALSEVSHNSEDQNFEDLPGNGGPSSLKSGGIVDYCYDGGSGPGGPGGSSEVSPLRWKKGQAIGEGTFGQVYKGMNERTGELLAVKQLCIADGTEEDVRTLRKEISVMWSLDHENIVRYLGTAQSDRYLFIIMEYVPGGSIQNMLVQFGPFNEKLIRRFTKHILSGVSYLHNKGIIHRDIKGANVLVNDTGLAKLADFGCSKQLAGMCTTSLEESLRAIRGSVPWMAPEVIKQSGHGRSSDIWSVGATVIEMATGKPPWQQFSNNLAALFHVATSKVPPAIPSHLSAGASSFLDRCLVIDPKARASATDLLKSDPFICSASPLGSSGGHRRIEGTASILAEESFTATSRVERKVPSDSTVSQTGNGVDDGCSIDKALGGDDLLAAARTAFTAGMAESFEMFPDDDLSVATSLSLSTNA